MRNVKGLTAAAAAVLLLSACTAAGSSSADEQPASNDGAEVSKAACRDTVVLGEDRVLDLSDAPDFQAWGLVDTADASVPFSTGSPVEIAWRVTGTGTFDTWLADPQGNRVEVFKKPVTSMGQGPDKPGEGWDAVYEFDEPGCWSLLVQRKMSDRTTAISIDLRVEERVPSFASIHEAYDAVAGVLGCDPGTTAEPVTVHIDGSTAEYRMCTDTVEIVRYDNEADRSKASDLLHGAENGPAYFAEGSNWHVLVLPGREGQAPGPEEIAALAQELGGRYISVPG
ncbi:hypothetical protein N2K95_09715 [Arthrobacter zhaoxinii]|uniref:Lipoprotein n=1 Tax=Arthrobacter zhaoxinii TaxID=2964616 RepID=A0ABY5YPJ0_9MICC|nr:hypothetical protein [Arthrobacter zhaoxinii]UWX95974.1 hypothetical protein N2K95_09715 [Arthrobacter zhaoxinii]